MTTPWPALSTLAVFGAMSMGLAGCASSTPDTTTGTARTPPVAQSNQPTQQKKKPHGWKAYSGKTTTGAEGLPPAANATVYSTKGAPVELASFWSRGKTLIIFYRGHW